MRKDTVLKRWKGIFSDFSCFVVGCSPSILNFNIDILKNSCTIGINNVLPIIDPYFLFWQDYLFWQDHHKTIQKSKSIKICSKNADPLGLFLNFKHETSHIEKPVYPSILFGRGSTGVLAVQFASTLGFKKIYLIGMDCKVENKKTDWFGENKRWKSHTLEMCTEGLKWISCAYGEKVIKLDNQKTLEDILEKDNSCTLSFEDTKSMTGCR